MLIKSAVAIARLPILSLTAIAVSLVRSPFIVAIARLPWILLVNPHDSATLPLQFLTHNHGAIADADEAAANCDLITPARFLIPESIGIAEVDRHAAATLGFQKYDQTLLIGAANIDSLRLDHLAGDLAATLLLFRLLFWPLVRALRGSFIAAALGPPPLFLTPLSVEDTSLAPLLAVALFSIRRLFSTRSILACISPSLLGALQSLLGAGIAPSVFRCIGIALSIGRLNRQHS